MAHDMPFKNCAFNAESELGRRYLECNWSQIAALAILQEYRHKLPEIGTSADIGFCDAVCLQEFPRQIDKDTEAQYDFYRVELLERKGGELLYVYIVLDVTNLPHTGGYVVARQHYQLRGISNPTQHAFPDVKWACDPASWLYNSGAATDFNKS